MSKRIKIGTNTFQCPDQARNPVHPYNDTREWQQITVIGALEDVKAAFVEGAAYSEEWDSIIIAEDGTEESIVETRDLSDYSIAGDIVDTRDGNVTVYMGRKTPMELLMEENAALLFENLTGEEF